MAEAADIATEIEAFVRKLSKISPKDKRFTRQIALWEAGYIDSLSSVEVLNFLEARFEVAFQSDVVRRMNTVSIEDLTELVMRQRKPG
jgi:acyl carrier protein